MIEHEKDFQKMSLSQEKLKEIAADMIEFLDFLFRQASQSATTLEDNGFTGDLTDMIDSLILFQDSCSEFNNFLPDNSRQIMEVSQVALLSCCKRILSAQEEHNAPKVAKLIREELLPVVDVWRTETIPALV